LAGLGVSINRHQPTGTEALREGLKDDVPPGVLLQFGPKGSYRLEHTLEFYEWECKPVEDPKDAVLYLHDYYAPNLDDSMDAFFETKGHVSTEIPPTCTGLLQTCDIRAHGPMERIYQRLEMADAQIQLRRGETMPCTSRSTVMARAISSYEQLNHDKVSLGFLDAAISNDLHGTQDDEISDDVRPIWDANTMHTRREEIRDWVKARVDSKEFTDFGKSVRGKGFLAPYPGSHSFLLRP